MWTTLLLTLGLAQLPATDTPDDHPALSIPPATIAPALTSGEQRQADLRRLVEMRRQRHAGGMARKNQALGRMRAQAAAREAQAAASRAQVAERQAIQNIAAAEQRRAAVAEAQYRLNSQVAGAPQVFVPGEGMVPYAYGVAPPLWWTLRQADPGSIVPSSPDLRPASTVLVPPTTPAP